MYTVPNQNIMTIHRNYPKSDFLQIKNENWQNMIKNTSDYYALALYLYFAANADGFQLAVSPAAINNAIGMSRSTYYKKLNLLKKCGYIIERKGNRLDFYETPQDAQEQKDENCGLPCEQQNLPQPQQNLPQGQNCSQQKQNSFPQNREIDNIDNIDNTNNAKKYLQKQWETEKGFVF